MPPIVYQALRRSQPIDIAAGLKAFPERWAVPWIMAFVDALAIELALLAGTASYEAVATWLSIDVGGSNVSGLDLAVLAVPVGYWLAGLIPGYGLGPIERSRTRVNVTLLVFAILFGRNYMELGQPWSAEILAATLVFSLILPPIAQVGLRRLLMSLGWWGLPVVIMGSDDWVGRIVRLLEKSAAVGFVPAGVINLGPPSEAIDQTGLPVFASWSEARQKLPTVDTAMMPITDNMHDELKDGVISLPFKRVLLMPNILEEQTLWVSVRDIGGAIALEMRNNLLLWQNQALKRLLDVALGWLLLLVSLPIIAVSAIAIRCVSPGSPFYAQVREGRDEKDIRVLKLRTMHPDADKRLEAYLEENPAARREWDQWMKLKDDPRILPFIGHLLRKWSLDELPQLWNVVRGDMSLVGPRPFPHYHLDAYDFKFRRLRRRVKPGITGLWQIEARSDGDIHVQQMLDTYYIRNWSLWLDIYLLFKTIPVVLARKGAV